MNPEDRDRVIGALFLPLAFWLLVFVLLGWAFWP